MVVSDGTVDAESLQAVADNLSGVGSGVQTPNLDLPTADERPSLPPYMKYALFFFSILPSTDP